MKKFFAWLLRFCCMAVIAMAVYTLIGCLQHINDDYSAAAIMGSTEVKTFESGNLPADSVPVQEMEVKETVAEEPTVRLSADGSATVNRPSVTVTAAFGNIINSVVADLTWYLNGSVIHEDKDCLLVEGSTMSYDAVIRVSESSPETAEVSVVVSHRDGSAEAVTEIPLEIPEPEEEESVVIRTQEIVVTGLRETEIFRDAELEVSAEDTFGEDSTALLLDYNSDKSLKLQFAGGGSGWVDAEDVEVSEDTGTTDEDYTDTQKEEFVNSMQYDSATSHLIWVSLYTQKVNVFSGYLEHWELDESFDCATGVNATPTTRGIFTVGTVEEEWDLGSVCVGPVMPFNGGEAFTSRPYDSETHEITDETMGEPASGGGVRMLEEDILWLAEQINEHTTVVVY